MNKEVTVKWVNENTNNNNENDYLNLNKVLVNLFDVFFKLERNDSCNIRINTNHNHNFDWNYLNIDVNENHYNNTVKINNNHDINQVLNNLWNILRRNNWDDNVVRIHTVCLHLDHWTVKNLVDCLT